MDTSLPHAPAAPASTSTHKRALTRRYKETPPPMGVYVIRNLATGHTHLNASLNLDGAMNRDRFELGLKRHRNKCLQDDWTRLGAENFRFEVIDTLKPRDEPGADYKTELAALLAMWREELA